MEQVSIKYLRCGQVVGHTSFNVNMTNDYPSDGSNRIKSIKIKKSYFQHQSVFDLNDESSFSEPFIYDLLEKSTWSVCLGFKIFERSVIGF